MGEKLNADLRVWIRAARQRPTQEGTWCCDTYWFRCPNDYRPVVLGGVLICGQLVCVFVDTQSNGPDQTGGFVGGCEFNVNGTGLDRQQDNQPEGEVLSLSVLPLLEGRSRCNGPDPLAPHSKLKSSKPFLWPRSVMLLGLRLLSFQLSFM